MTDEIKLNLTRFSFVRFDNDDNYVIYDYLSDNVLILKPSEINVIENIRNLPNNVNIYDLHKKVVTKIKMFDSNRFGFNGYHYCIEKDNGDFYKICLVSIDNIDNKRYIFVEPFVSEISLSSSNMHYGGKPIKIIGGSSLFKHTGYRQYISNCYSLENWSEFNVKQLWWVV